MLCDKKNERFLGIKMKAFIIVLLIIALLGGAAFGAYYFFFDGAAAGDVYEIANSSKPTKVTTEVSYVTKSGDNLSGYYVTTVDGNNTVFEYSYDRLYTPAESVAEGTNARIKTVEGVINYIDGVYSGDQEEWKPGTGTALDLKFNLDKSKLKEATLNEDGTVLTAKIAPENAAAIIGTNLSATEDIEITVQTNGVNLTMILVSCNTANGAMTIRTSYTYNAQDLTPEQGEN